MRYTQMFIPTVREVPSDAVIASHILMIRAGMIRQLAAGAYTYLPLGYRVLQKAERIVREEMNAAGAIELHMPVVIPIEAFRKTGRDEAYGELMFRIKDRNGTMLALGPTHEEVITQIVADHVNSYRQLPLNLYQIQTKFRDEERPKSGVLRTREFLMKDAYSFHTSLESLEETYQKMYAAYENMFKRCGLPVVSVEAESGPIGGSASHEFMVLTDVGEDSVVSCGSCSYAANIERAARKVSEVSPGDKADGPELREVHTPGMTTIAQVSEFLKVRPDQMIKTLVYRSGEHVIVGLVRGDHDINESKLARAAGVETVELADEGTIRKLTGAEVGFAGPVKLSAEKMIVDIDVWAIADGVTGANKTDYHLVGVVPGRDFAVDADRVADIRNVAQGDQCPKCSGELAFERAIEVGHVFKLGTKYSTAIGAEFTDAEGKSHSMIMGCYGIGINRILAAAIEVNHDESGIIWPISIAPYEVIILPLSAKDEQVAGLAEKLHDELEAAGVDVLLDDRDARPGVKFKDADLIGIPVRVTIGPKGLANNVVEVKLRNEAEAKNVPVDQAGQYIRQLVEDLHRQLGE